MITMRLGWVAACLVALFLGASEAQDSGEGTVSFSPTAAPSPTPVGTSAPTSFLDQVLNNESLNSAASNLSTGAIGGIVAACIVVALIVGAVYLLFSKRARGCSFLTVF